MAKLMPSRRVLRARREHWTTKVEPLRLGGLKMTIDFQELEEHEPEFASMRAKGQVLSSWT